MRHVLLTTFWCCLCLAAVAQAGKPVRPAQLPAFRFQRVDGSTAPFTNADLKPNLATVVLFFDPHCTHCQQQAAWLRSGSAALRNVQFLWVGTAPAKELADFRQQHIGESRYPHYVVKDAQYAFDGLFGYSVAPTLLVFDAGGKFRGAFSNEVAADEIARLL